MGTRSYRILDVDLVLESPQQAFLDDFHRDYRRFERDGPPEGNSLRVHFEDGNRGEGTFLEVEGLRENLEDHPQPERHAAQSLAQVVMERVESFTILHAAVLASQGGALAICGPSGAGKSTLTLALLESGWSYYSDDFCPIHRETNLVHAFPRSIWVRSAPEQEASNHRRGKVLFPLDGKGFPIGGPPLPLRWFICLDGSFGKEVSGMGKFQLVLRAGMEGPVLAALQGIEGTEVQKDGKIGSLGWTVRHLRKGVYTRRIKDILHRHRDAIWNVFSLPDTHSDFSKEPALAQIPPHEAAFFLLQELKHGLAEEGRPGSLKPGALLSHLSTLLSGVACYRLTPGPLDRCLALIQAELNLVETT